MSATLVQSKTGTSNLATTTAAFDAAPATGNMIILSFISDAYNSAAGSGWTESSQMGIRSGSNHGAYKWWSISTGANSFQYTIGSAVTSNWVLEEWAGLASSPYDVSASAFQTSSVNTYTTTSVTPTTGERLVHAGIGTGQNAGGQGYPGQAPGTWSNSFTRVAGVGGGAGTGTVLAIATAYRTVTGDGSTPQATTATWPDPSYQPASSQTGLVISFKVASSSAPANTTPAVVTGTAAVGQTLTRSTAGAWDGSPTPTVTGKWQRSDNGTTGWTDISGATSTTYVLQAADETKYIRYLESATNSVSTVTQASNVKGPIASAPPLAFSARLSGGSSNTNPATSIGGVESSSAYIGTKTAGNLFDDSPFTEYNASGFVDYRCIYVHNDDVVGATAIAYVSQQLASGRSIAIGAATQAAGSTATAITNDTTAPSGVTFSAPTSAGTGISLGTIGAGQGKGLWIRRTISAGAAASNTNAWEISYEITSL